jgi:thioredoxin reductase (NADPH)
MAGISVYGTTTCSDCIRSKRFLTEHGIAFDWVDLAEHPEEIAYIAALQVGAQRTPTIVFPDGTFLAEPSDAELAAKLGLSLAA